MRGSDVTRTAFRSAGRSVSQRRWVVHQKISRTVQRVVRVCRRSRRRSRWSHSGIMVSPSLRLVHRLFDLWIHQSAQQSVAIAATTLRARGWCHVVVHTAGAGCDEERRHDCQVCEFHVTVSLPSGSKLHQKIHRRYNWQNPTNRQTGGGELSCSV